LTLKIGLALWVVISWVQSTS